MTKTNHLGSLVKTVGLLAAVGLLVLMLGLVEARPARATFPGKPGKIAFSSFDRNDDDIYTISTLFQVTNNATKDLDPSYSPGGDKIAYDSYDGSDDEIYTIDATGDVPFQVTDNTTEDRYPSYSPDAKKIAYAGYDGSDY